MVPFLSKLNMPPGKVKLTRICQCDINVCQAKNADKKIMFPHNQKITINLFITVMLNGDVSCHFI